MSGLLQPRLVFQRISATRMGLYYGANQRYEALVGTIEEKDGGFTLHSFASGFQDTHPRYIAAERALLLVVKSEMMEVAKQ